MLKELKVITQNLKKVADEKPPIAPFKRKRKKAPPKFPYEEYTLKPPEDARKIIQTLEALQNRAQEIQDMESSYKAMRTQVEQKISELKQESGYDKIIQEMQVFQKKIIEDTFDTAGNTLIEYNNIVMTVMEKVTSEKVENQEIHDKMVEAIEKYAGPEIAGKIIEEADQAIKELKQSREKVQRKLEMWPSPEDLRKKVREEVPASKTAGVMDVLKGIGRGLKDIWTGITDKVSDLWNSITSAEPIVTEMEQLLSQSETTASKKRCGIAEDIDAAMSYIQKGLSMLKNLNISSDFGPDPQSMNSFEQMLSDWRDNLGNVEDLPVKNKRRRRSSITSSVRQGIAGEEVWTHDKTYYEGEYQEKFDSSDKELNSINSIFHKYGVEPTVSSDKKTLMWIRCFDSDYCDDWGVEVGSKLNYPELLTFDLPEELLTALINYEEWLTQRDKLFEEYSEEYSEEYPPIEGE